MFRGDVAKRRVGERENGKEVGNGFGLTELKLTLRSVELYDVGVCIASGYSAGTIRNLDGDVHGCYLLDLREEY